MTDEQLNDSRDFDGLYVRHSDRARTFVRRFIGKRFEHLNEEIVQSIFQRLRDQPFAPGIAFLPHFYALSLELIAESAHLATDSR
ncbi:hypothetical protein Pan44_35630 [Caulifigura coniformis]|uniref:Uncharacterized protein n=1 Tax=Caulifigura coniformis TaxID=2527983 RepID=A0A517SHB1_9PLAN|nr:hypothetical protein [Caulifigura coniformis]QDT55519.1 hypothetical protein Pan44_35630 [Caulifigura coniformis]